MLYICMNCKNGLWIKDKFGREYYDCKLGSLTFVECQVTGREEYFEPKQIGEKSDENK